MMTPKIMGLPFEEMQIIHSSSIAPAAADFLAAAIFDKPDPGFLLIVEKANPTLVYGALRRISQLGMDGIE